MRLVPPASVLIQRPYAIPVPHSGTEETDLSYLDMPGRNRAVRRAESTIASVVLDLHHPNIVSVTKVSGDSLI